MLGFRFVYGFRIVAPFVIGLTGFSAVRFALLNAPVAAAVVMFIIHRIRERRAAAAAGR